MMPTKDKPQTQEQHDESALDYVKRLASVGIRHRDQFVSVWQGLEAQIEQQEPAEWRHKEAWQTRAIIPLQSKKSEIAPAQLNRILFPSRFFFTIAGTEEHDRTRDDLLVTLLDRHLERSRFHFSRRFGLQEGCDNGLSFVKFLANAKGDGLQAEWVSVYSSFWDPTIRHDWRAAKYWGHTYTRDWGELLQETEDGVYDNEDGDGDATKQRLQAVLDAGQGKANEILTTIRGRSGMKPVDDDRLRLVRSIFGFGLVQVPQDWVSIKMTEFWGLVKVPQVDASGTPAGYRFESRKIVLANDFLLQDVPNAFDHTFIQQAAIPAFPIRIKPRKYELVGKGYLYPSSKIQDLTNQLVNLGFDSLKIGAMDIIILDQTKVKDARSIQYKPLAVWKVSDVNAVKIQRAGLSGLGEILKGLATLISIDEDTSGVTKSTAGTQSVESAGQEQTLGEFQRKAQQVDDRFVEVASFLEEDFLIPVLWFYYAALKNKKVYTAGQKGIDRILGTTPIEDAQQVPGGPQTTSKLSLAELPKADEAVWDFQPLGVTNFILKLKRSQALEKALARATSNEMLLMLTKVDLLYRDLLNSEEIPEATKYIRTKEELKTFMANIKQAQPGATGGPAIAQPPKQPRLAQPKPAMRG